MTGAARTTLGKMTQGARPKRRVPLPVGRHTKLTPEISKRICDAVRAGNFISVAARYAGVSEYTVHQWISRGRGEHQTLPASAIYVQFVRDLDEAEAGGEVAAVLHWRSAMPKDWHSAEKWLQTRYADRWGTKPPEMARSAAFAGVQVNIGGNSGQIASQTHSGALESPIGELLDTNPDLIAGTMQLLDQFLPIEANSPQMAQIGTESANPVQNDVIEGQFRQIAPETQPEVTESDIPRQFEPFDPELGEIE